MLWLAKLWLVIGILPPASACGFSLTGQCANAHAGRGLKQSLKETHTRESLRFSVIITCPKTKISASLECSSQKLENLLRLSSCKNVYSLHWCKQFLPHFPKAGLHELSFLHQSTYSLPWWRRWISAGFAEHLGMRPWVSFSSWLNTKQNKHLINPGGLENNREIGEDVQGLQTSLHPLSFLNRFLFSDDSSGLAMVNTDSSSAVATATLRSTIFSSSDITSSGANI